MNEEPPLTEEQLRLLDEFLPNTVCNQAAKEIRRLRARNALLESEGVRERTDNSEIHANLGRAIAGLVKIQVRLEREGHLHPAQGVRELINELENWHAYAGEVYADNLTAYSLWIGWFHHDPRSTDPRHLALHVAKLAGKFADYEEKCGHLGPEALAEARADLLEKRIPDLFILGAMLAKAHGLTRGELEGRVAGRSKEVMGRGRP